MFNRFADRMIGRIVLGLILMGIGGCMIYYSANLVGIFGRNRWADEHLGGSRQLWLLIGFGLVIIGGLITLGIINLSSPANISSNGFN